MVQPGGSGSGIAEAPTGAAPTGALWDDLVPQDVYGPPPSQPNAGHTPWSATSPIAAPQGPPQPQPAYPSMAPDDEETTSSSMTSSDDGTEILEGLPDVRGMTESQAAEAYYQRYRQARKGWRRLTGNR